MISLQRSGPSEAHGKSFGTNSAETKPGRAGTQTHPGEITISSLSDKSYGTIPKKMQKGGGKRNFFRIWRGGKKELFCSEGKGSILNGIFWTVTPPKRKTFYRLQSPHSFQKFPWLTWQASRLPSLAGKYSNSYSSYVNEDTRVLPSRHPTLPFFVWTEPVQVKTGVPNTC